MKMRPLQILGTRIELMARLGGVQRWWDLISVFVGLPVRPDTGGGNGGPIGYNLGSTAGILTKRGEVLLNRILDKICPLQMLRLFYTAEEPRNKRAKAFIAICPPTHTHIRVTIIQLNGQQL